MESNLKKIVIMFTMLIITFSVILIIMSKGNTMLSLLLLGIGYVFNGISYIYYKLNNGGSK